MQTINLKSKIYGFEMGYTLVELLVVIVVLVVIGAIISSILVTTLRGSNRSTTVNDVRQSGNYVLGQMSKMIAYAMVFDGVSQDGTNYATNCVPGAAPGAGTPTPTPPSYSYIKITAFDNGVTVFSCPNANQNSIASGSASNPSPMIDTSDLKVTNCYFTCEQQSLTSPPIIDINFTLGKKNAGLFVENNISIPFETSVAPRNTNQ